MPITRTFTDAADIYSARLADTYFLRMLGGDDRLGLYAGTTRAYLGVGADLARVEAASAHIFGEAGADRFEISGSGSTLDGGADDDLFNLRGGTDSTLRGMTGNDRFTFLADTSGVLAGGGDGNDLFRGNGHAVSGRLLGGAGNDRFQGFGGENPAALVLGGGVGNDVYRLDAGLSARVAELAGEGVDTVQITRGTSYVLGRNVENLTVLDLPGASGTASLFGNALGNRISGSADAEIMRGGGGNDRLLGGGGDDRLFGGDGNDRITGGAGIDHIETGAGRDTVIYTSPGDAPMTDPLLPDFIADWEAVDRIDLSAIDANSEVAGNQAFTFAGYSFGEPAGEQPAGSLIIGGFGGELYISLFLDGDGEADMVISLWSAAGESGLKIENIIV